MSRAAALADRKGSQKAAIAAKKAEHEADLAMGLNATMQKIIRDDELLCTVCGATKLGPETKCSCPGGRSKPGPDYCVKAQLVAAAKARTNLNAAAAKKEATRRQAEVQSARDKKKAGLGQIDPDAEFQGDGIELQVVFKFPIGPLGFALHKNTVTDVTGEPALELGVKKGYVLYNVAGEPVPADKAAIGKQIMGVFKEQKVGLVDFVFRTPIMDGFVHCYKCDKFQDAASFEPA
eukprot:CAMPEP_0206250764 /NCGR_PEP_ID=MMETSP0047_2-20121206/21655_1 /ASSEMBLY_ACC=CAM_ASM_000192 /TAXON_ID=195065 /ORGANISM="Chroomonas mesostigmatica_cf, Strain CCMP1168" /LENGTH=234 /DNA_ID=CAMNT_0053676653 /DNA_START=59 /DNA_END=760 /DNA_ORIENTATION=+